MALKAEDGKKMVELEVTTTSIVDEAPEIVDDIVDCMWQTIVDELVQSMGYVPKMSLDLIGVIKFKAARLVSFLFMEPQLTQIHKLNKNGTSAEIRCALRTMMKGVEKIETEKVLKKANDDNEFSALPNCDRVCPKCKKKTMRETSVQTRSADEPSTIFVRCVVCEYTIKE